MHRLESQKSHVFQVAAEELFTNFFHPDSIKMICVIISRTVQLDHSILFTKQNTVIFVQNKTTVIHHFIPGALPSSVLNQFSSWFLVI
jgi:hypothetical protein